MRIADLYQQDDPVISFEFFPPKSDAGYAALLRTIEDLKGIEPGFVSVTMGAGGSTREKTVGVVKQIETEIGLTAMCHLPCVSQSRKEVPYKSACCGHVPAARWAWAASGAQRSPQAATYDAKSAGIEHGTMTPPVIAASVSAAAPTAAESSGSTPSEL